MMPIETIVHRKMLVDPRRNDGSVSGSVSWQTHSTCGRKPSNSILSSTKSERGWGEYEGGFDEYETPPPGIGPGSAPGPAAACPPYQRGEVEKSKTQQGHLPSDFIQHPRGTLIADFAVDWRTPKSSLRRDARCAPGSRRWSTWSVPTPPPGSGSAATATASAGRTTTTSCGAAARCA